MVVRASAHVESLVCLFLRDSVWLNVWPGAVRLQMESETSVPVWLWRLARSVRAYPAPTSLCSTTHFPFPPAPIHVKYEPRCESICGLICVMELRRGAVWRQRAVEIVQKAIDDDKKQNYQEAYRQYQNALDYFMLALRCTLLLPLPLLLLVSLPPSFPPHALLTHLQTSRTASRAS